MTEEDLDNKFNAMSDKLLNKKRQKAIKKMIFNCEKKKAREFMERLIV